VSTEIPFPNDSDVEKVNWIEAKTFLDSLKERNYPSEEIVKIEKFLISEGLLNSQ